MTISDATYEMSRVAHFYRRSATDPVGNAKLVLDLKHRHFRLLIARSTARSYANIVAANYLSIGLVMMSSAHLKSQSIMLVSELQRVLSSRTLMIILA